MKGIVISPDNKVRIQNFGKPLYKTVGALWGGYIEIVRPRYLERPFLLIIDDKGRLKDDPEINMLPSLWYGYLFAHGEPIVGTAVVMKEGFMDGEPDVVGLSDQDAEYLTAMINKQLEKLGRKEKAARSGCNTADGKTHGKTHEKTTPLF